MYAAAALVRHPGVHMAAPVRPEPKFFLVDELYAKGLGWYSSRWFESAPAQDDYLFGRIKPMQRLVEKVGMPWSGQVRVQLMGSGTILREVLAAAELARPASAVDLRHAVGGLDEEGEEEVLDGVDRQDDLEAQAEDRDDAGREHLVEHIDVARDARHHPADRVDGPAGRGAAGRQSGRRSAR